MPEEAFICHASEDKEVFVRSLAEHLRDSGVSVWYDEYSLRPGDSLRRSIDRGLRECKLGIVVLSQAFFSKEWPQKELDGLIARETSGTRLLPIWHEIEREEISAHSPLLADIVALPSSGGFGPIIEAVQRALGIKISGRALTQNAAEWTIVLQISPDGTLAGSKTELRVMVKEYLFAIEEGNKPHFRIDICHEIMPRVVTDLDALLRLDCPSSEDVVLRKQALEIQEDLTIDAREELLDCIAISRELDARGRLLCRALEAILTDQSLRGSGFLGSAEDLACAVSATVSRFFRDFRIPSDSTRIDLYQMSYPELITHIRLTSDELDALLANVGSTDRMILTFPGTWRVWDLPFELVVEKAIPAIALEVYTRQLHLPDYEPMSEFLNLPTWYIGLG